MTEETNAPAGRTEDDLATHFEALPDEDDQAEQVQDDQQDDQQAGDAGQVQDDQAEQADETDEGVEDEPAEPDPEGRHKVLAKNERGEIVEQRVSFKELREGYQRAQDYDNLKTQSEQHVRQVVTQATQEIDRARTAYGQELAQMRALVNQALDIVSPEQLISLSSSDPLAYGLALQKQQMFQGIAARLGETLQREQQERQQQDAARQQQVVSQQREKALGALKEAGLTSQAVQKIYDEAGPLYGYSPQELSPNLDHRLVLLLKDAAELKRLKAKSHEAATKVRAAPKLPAKPAAKASMPAALPRTRDELAAAFMRM